MVTCPMGKRDLYFSWCVLLLTKLWPPVIENSYRQLKLKCRLPESQARILVFVELRVFQLLPALVEPEFLFE